MLTLDCTMALGMMPSRLTRRKKWDLGQDKATASPRAAAQWATQMGELTQLASEPGLSHSWLFRRPTEWLQPRLLLVNLDYTRQLTITSPKEKLQLLLLHVFLHRTRDQLEHCFFTLALHMHILVNIIYSAVFFHKERRLGSLEPYLPLCVLVSKKII